MIEIGNRKRNQPAPPSAIFAALIDPDRDPARPWLKLLRDEIRPRVLRSQEHSMVLWSSLWTARPDAQIRFDLPRSAGHGTDLSWTLLVDEPPPHEALVSHLRYRLNELINRDLRYTFGQ